MSKNYGCLLVFVVVVVVAAGLFLDLVLELFVVVGGHIDLWESCLKR